MIYKLKTVNQFKLFTISKSFYILHVVCGVPLNLMSRLSRLQLSSCQFKSRKNRKLWYRKQDGKMKFNLFLLNYYKSWYIIKKINISFTMSGFVVYNSAAIKI